MASEENINPDINFPQNYPANIKKRMFSLGMEIYQIAVIDRKDKNARRDFFKKNYKFFNAPVVSFITTTCEPSTYIGMDIGCFLATFMLLAREHNLGTCTQASLVAFPDVVRGKLKIPDNEKLLCGISIGYPVLDDKLNQYHTDRVSIDEILTMHDR